MLEKNEDERAERIIGYSNVFMTALREAVLVAEEQGDAEKQHSSTNEIVLGALHATIRIAVRMGVPITGFQATVENFYKYEIEIQKLEKLTEDKEP